MTAGGGYFAQLKGGAAVTQASAMNMVKAGIKGLAPHYLGVALTELPARFLTRRSVRRSELAALCNVVRCPAHHEVLVTALEMALGDVCPRPDICKEYDELMKDCRG